MYVLLSLVTHIVPEKPESTKSGDKIGPRFLNLALNFSLATEQ